MSWRNRTGVRGLDSSGSG